MGTIELNNKVMELKELEQFADEIAAEIEALKDQIKKEMADRNTDEMTVGVFTVRWKEYESNRFNGKKFKAEHADLYDAYKSKVKTRKFTIQ